MIEPLRSVPDQPLTAVELLMRKQQELTRQAASEANPETALALSTIAVCCGEVALALLKSKETGVA